MMKQYLEIKSRYRDAILLYRMGDFYEMFFEDAEVAAPILQITLTSRDGEIPMCGIPHHALDSYLIKLIRSGNKIAICEQMEDPSQAKGLVRREVVRVLTPGCIPESVGLEERDHHYLASYDGETLGLMDVSTGSIHLYSVQRSSIVDHMRLFPIKEILLPGTPAEFELTGVSIPITPLDISYFDRRAGMQQLSKILGTASLKGFGLMEGDPRSGVAGALLRYVRETQFRDDAVAVDLIVHDEQKVIDATSIRNLEIFQSSLGDPRHSLHAVLDRTMTPMGARLLRTWMREPLSSLEEIQHRLGAVEELVRRRELRQSLSETCKGMGDLERQTSRVAYGREHPRDLLAIADTLDRSSAIYELLATVERSTLLKELRDTLNPPMDLAAQIRETLVDQPPLQIREGGLIRDGVDERLDEARSIQSESRSAILALEETERRATGISNLKVGYNRVYGYYVEVSRGQVSRVPEHYIRKQTLVNAERFITPGIKELEEKILHANETVASLELELYEDLRNAVLLETNRIMHVARNLAIMDCLLSFATAARDGNYVKPDMHTGSSLSLRESRHPVVEKVLREEPFTPNDCDIPEEGRRILIITGPNMGGKSTYLRQVALAAYMSHIGSFVPATEASIPLFDRIFTRVGAFDQLAQGESTFMVEMLELAQILRKATDRSLIILDEVGRGTATFDGLSLAWAVVEHIHEQIGAKTLFATHYHELTELALLLPGVRNLSVDVKEFEGKIFFIHRIVDGTADRSYGIEVAHLAGVPSEIVSRAKEVLANLEKSELDPRGIPRAAQGMTDVGQRQLTLFPSATDIVADQIRSIDLDSLKPLDALTLLARFQSRLNRED